ncbi:MAG: type II toxin-antitoxin system VapB family antitoxin [Acidobacteriota bacterium]
MPINIKNEQVTRLAVELAEVMGTSITEAVGEAAREKLARIRGQGGRQGVADQLMALAAKCVRNAPAEWLTRDFDAELYDERGLPR